MQQLLDRLSEQICVCTDAGSIIYCNQAMLQELGYEQHELTEKNITEWIKIDLTDDRAAKEPIICEYINKQGQEKLGAVTIVDEEWQGQKIKMLIGQKNEQKLEMIEAFLKHVKPEICIKSPTGKYVYINESCARRTGTPIEELLGRTDITFFNQETADMNKKEDEEVRRTGRISILEKEIEIDGKLRIYEVTKIPFEFQEEIYIGLIMRDITMTTQVQNKCIEAMDDLEKVCSYQPKKTMEEEFQGVRDVIEEYVGTKTFNVWVYDKEGERIIPYFRSPGLEENLDGQEGFPISETAIQNYKNGNFKKVRATNSFPIAEGEMEIDYTKPIYYIVLNPIIYGNEFLGVVTMIYNEYPDSKVTQNYVTDNLIDQIGFILKKDNIYNRLSEEWRKRIAGEKELQLFLSVATDFTIKLKRNKEVIEVNSSRDNILGWDKETYLSLAEEELVHPEDYKKYRYIFEKKYLPEKLLSFTIRMKRKDGNYAWISWNGVYVKDKDYIIYTAKDITYEKELEEKEDVANKILKMEQMKNEFFANISHELKTPITIILASIQVLRNAINEESIHIEEDFDGEKYMRMLQQNSYRLLRLVSNLIDVTKIEAGYYTLNKVNINIVNIVEEIALSVVEYAKQKEIELLFDTDVEEEVIACDPDKIERIILNLLSNAIKHTPTGGNITVEITIVPKYVVIRVNDTGKGIPKEKLESIFDRFVQIQDVMSHVNGGSGIGLSLVKSLVESHDGSVKVISEYGKGSDFIVKLPRKQLEGEQIMLENLITGQERFEKCSIEFSDIYNIYEVK